jgi:hypothetical protein
VRAWLLVAAFVLAPLIPVAMIGTHALRRARDIWLRGVLAAGCCWLCWAEPIFAPLAFWALVTWRTPGTHAALLGWLAVMATWFLARAIPVDLWPWVATGWLGVGALQVALIVRQRLHRDYRPHAGRAPFGTLGQRTFAAGFLALLVPFSPWWGWPVLALGLWLTGPSWGAVLSLAMGLGVLNPWLWVPSLALATAGGLLIATKGRDWTPHGGSLDSLRERGNAFRLLWRRWALPGWTGRGPDSMTRDLRMLWHQDKARLGVYAGTISELHCEPLHLCWEYGAFGVATVLLATYRIGSGLTWGDPFSAAAVIGAGLACTTFPLRVAPVGLVILAIWARVTP